MSDDNELKVMASILPAMESLNEEERARVINWLVQKLAIGIAQPKPILSAGAQHSGTQPLQGSLNITTDTIANITNAQSGTDLIMAAAAQLHLSQGKPKFTRQELVNEMRTAPGHFKETFINNLSKYLVGLTKADRLRLVGQNTYALSNKERQVMEAAIANAG